MAYALYKNCLILAMAIVLEEQADVRTGKIFRREANRYLGVSNLDGLPPADQIKRMNSFLKHKLEPLPNTTFIRAWLENIDSLDEYLLHFKQNWAKDIINIGVFNE